MGGEGKGRAWLAPALAVALLGATCDPLLTVDGRIVDADGRLIENCRVWRVVDGDARYNGFEEAVPAGSGLITDSTVPPLSGEQRMHYRIDCGVDYRPAETPPMTYDDLHDAGFEVEFGTIVMEKAE